MYCGIVIKNRHSPQIRMELFFRMELFLEVSLTLPVVGLIDAPLMHKQWHYPYDDRVRFSDEAYVHIVQNVDVKIMVPQRIQILRYRLSPTPQRIPILRYRLSPTLVATTAQRCYLLIICATSPPSRGSISVPANSSNRQRR